MKAHKKKLHYPEYINGVKQIQNPIARFFIKLWYSFWYRAIFIAFPTWSIIFALISLLAYKIGFIKQLDFMPVLMGTIYGFNFWLGLLFNDYSNLRKIGLDEYHIPIINDYEDNKNSL